MTTFAQNELKGTWVLESYTVDSRKPTEIKDRLKKDKVTFDEDGRYIKRYYQEDLPEGARIHMTYNFLDGKVTKKYFDKDGYELKVVRVIKKIDNGTYKKISAGEIRVLTEKDSCVRMFKVDGRYLTIADTLKNKVIWKKYKRRS
jgi:hypothetical protein